MSFSYLVRLLVATLGLLLCALVFVSVLGRSFVMFRLPGSDELAVIAGMWLCFIGMAMATYNRSHITDEVGELITRTPRSNLLRKLFVEFCVAGIMGYAAYLAVNYTVFTFEVGRKTSYFRLPAGFVTMSMAVGFVAMFVLSLNSLRRLVIEFITSERS